MLNRLHFFKYYNKLNVVSGKYKKIDVIMDIITVLDCIFSFNRM